MVNVSAGVFTCQSVEPLATWLAASRSFFGMLAGIVPVANSAIGPCTSGRQVRMLRVDGLEHVGHVELDLDAIAVLPSAIDLCEFAGLRSGADALAVHGNARSLHRPMQESGDRWEMRLGVSLLTSICVVGVCG